MTKHPLISTLLNLRGNPRAVVFTEPLFGIPFNLYAPYLSVFILALGVTDSQIGLIASVSLALQVATALLSGAITDKMGRRLTTFVFDCISWLIPCILWILAQNFYYFLVAAVVNSLFRITMNSFNLLLVEDAEEEQLVNIFTWIYISGLLVAFIAPVAGILVDRFTLIPTIRGIFVFTLVVFTAKFFILYRFSTETRRGKIKMEESRGMPFFAVLKGYRGVLGQILHSPRTLYTLGIMLVMAIVLMVNGNFWSIIVTTKLHFPPGILSASLFIKSIVELALFFVVMPRLTARGFKAPLLAGFIAFSISQLILVTMPQGSYVLLILNMVLEGCGIALVSPMLDTLTVLFVDAAERARIKSILSMSVLALSAPFGWIAGLLSGVDRALPFVMNLALVIIGGWLVLQAARANRSHVEAIDKDISAEPA